MMAENISGENYEVNFDPELRVVALSGVLRLNGLIEYAPIASLLSRLLSCEGPGILDLSALEFLNSSGIAVLSKFIIEARNRQVDLTLKGSNLIAWQTKSLVNLQRLMPSLQMELA